MTLIGGGSGGVAGLIIYFLLITYLVYYPFPCVLTGGTR